MAAIMRASEGWLSNASVLTVGADQQLAPDTHMTLGAQDKGEPKAEELNNTT